MAEQIIQTLGFDASQAISNIGRLNGALTGMTSNLIAASNAAKTFNGQTVSKSLGKITAGAKGAEAALGRLAKKAGGINNVSNSLKNASKSSAGFTLSLQTLSRIVFAQTIVRGINLVQGKMREAVTTAVDFNLALSEAAAISPRGVTNFAGEVTRLNSELIDTSNSFGFDVLDLAEAKYQEFSNQVKGSADSNKLFIESNRLARISASTVGEAVGALSSVLNSYGEDVSQADKAAAVLFKTVELGRVRLKDIADQLGNVTPLAKSAGISFIELGASIATITRSGVSASRSLTQVRALINQLQKPPEALRKIFRDVFQVEGIEEAIEKFGGLQGVIEAVADEAGGSTSKVAKFFTNIRARNAFIALNDQSENFTKALDANAEAAANASTFLGDLLEKFDEQDAVKFQKALTELNNAFLTLAQDALPTITSALGFFTGAVQDLSRTVTAIGGTAMAAYGFRLIRTAGLTEDLIIQTKLLKNGYAGLAIGIGIAAIALLDFLDHQAALGGIAEKFDEIEDISADNIKNFAKVIAEATKEVEGLAKQSLKTLGILDAAARRGREPIRQANDAFVATLDSTLKDLVSSREKVVRALENQITGLESRVTQRSQDGASIREEIADNEFDRRQRNLNELQKAFTRQERAEKALKKAQATPTTATGLTERIKQLDRVKKLTEESVAAAGKSGSRAQLFNAEKLLNKVLNEQLATKKAQNALDANATELAKTKLADERKNLKDLKGAVEDFRGSLSVFTEGGAVLGPDERDAAIANAKEARDKILALRFGAGDLSAGDLLGIADQEVAFNQLLNNIRPQFDGVQEGLIAALEEVSKTTVLKIPVELLVRSAERLGIDPTIDPADQLASIRRITAETKTETNALLGVQKDLLTATEKVAEAKAKTLILTERIAKSDKITSRLQAVTGLPRGGEQQGAFQKDFARLQQLSKADVSDANRDEINLLLDRLGDLGSLPGLNIPKISVWGLEFGGGKQAFVKKFMDTIKQQIDAQNEVLELEADVAPLLEAQTLQQVLNDSLSKQKEQEQTQGNISAEIQKSTGQQEVLTDNQSDGANAVGGMQAGYKAANTQLVELIKKQQKHNALAASGKAQPKMHGGPLYRSFGGFTSRGTDTVPAMLSHGETVINARSSRKFASQINAMNAGVTPVYRAEGGVVNNSVNVGDINVNGTSDPDTTARRVMSQIRREERRGTSSRFKSR